MLNRFIAGIIQYMPERLVWIFSKRYIAGKTREEAFAIARQLNKEGIKVTLDLLGEFLTKYEKIEQYKTEYLKTIEAADNQNIDTSFSVKPTMFGLLIDWDLCYNNIREIVSKAAAGNRIIQIDMEDSQCTDMEIDLFKKLHNEFPEHVGFVFQAYMHRTLNDLHDITAVFPGKKLCSIRLCKGIYNEPEEIAFKKKKEINKNYLKGLEFLFQHNVYAAIATHDIRLITGALKLIEQYNVSPENFEFQMLYGVKPKLCREISRKGFTMRVYVPYGKDWMNYSVRRLKENPNMVFHIIKALIFRN
jgi:proline dehydrogenase